MRNNSILHVTLETLVRLVAIDRSPLKKLNQKAYANQFVAIGQNNEKGGRYQVARAYYQVALFMGAENSPLDSFKQL